MDKISGKKNSQDKFQNKVHKSTDGVIQSMRMSYPKANYEISKYQCQRKIVKFSKRGDSATYIRYL